MTERPSTLLSNISISINLKFCTRLHHSLIILYVLQSHALNYIPYGFIIDNIGTKQRQNNVNRFYLQLCLFASRLA